MISLLSNKDDYQFNILLAPGLTDVDHTAQITSMITNTQNRGDSMLVVDPRAYGASVANAVTTAGTRNSSYAAAYWPWVQVVDPELGNMAWVPASTVMAGVFAYNDSVSEPWFAPAGINRGGLSQVVRAEKKLTQANRDTLYSGKVNPIATFPGTGVVVYGQKTLQTRASALDRVNVRRLLIQLKSYISQVSQNLVFEQNTAATRNNFLAQVNPYLESVQQRQGLYAFKVVMDDTNNTADVIDRNQLVGQIYIQPTKTAEFIYLDFNILPTGATFPA
jgi:phage tail sheath protein FI